MKSQDEKKDSLPLDFILQGKPRAWARAAPSKYGPKMYDTQKSEKLVDGICIAQQHGNRPLFKGPLCLKAIFFFFRADQKYWGKLHKSTPDNSNLIKYLEDTCKSILYEDDRLIAQHDYIKVWAGEEKTEFSIIELEDY